MLLTLQSESRQGRQRPGTLQTTPVSHDKRSIHPEDRVARLQSVHGNQGMMKLMNGGLLQRKLSINQPGDRFEQEAHRNADASMRMTDRRTPDARTQPRPAP